MLTNQRAHTVKSEGHEELFRTPHVAVHSVQALTMFCTLSIALTNSTHHHNLRLQFNPFHKLHSSLNPPYKPQVKVAIVVEVKKLRGRYCV